MDITALALLAPVKKILDLYRFLVAGEVQLRAAAYTVGAWVLGTGIVFLVDGSSFAGEVGLALEGWQDFVLAGVTLGSLGSVVHDAIQPAGVTYTD